MKANIKAPKQGDTRLTVSKLTLEARSERDQMFLSAIAYALFPIHGPDVEFVTWLQKQADKRRLELEAKKALP